MTTVRLQQHLSATTARVVTPDAEHQNVSIVVRKGRAEVWRKGTKLATMEGVAGVVRTAHSNGRGRAWHVLADTSGFDSSRDWLVETSNDCGCH